MSRVESKDHGAAALLRRFQDLKESTLRVGILDRGDDDHGGLSVAEIAAFHEFGIGQEERSFIRGWYDEFLTRNRALWKQQMVRVARGELSRDQALQQLGALFVGQIQQRIRARIPPPLADSTVEKKGSDVPLIDTGQLWSSIAFDLERE